MTKHTSRDDVCNKALQLATNEESFSIEDIASSKDVDTSERTVRDTLNTLIDFGWLSKEKDRGHTFQPGPLALGEDTTPEGTPVSDFRKTSEISEGEVYFGTVDEYTSNAIITLPVGNINLGPIDESALGDEVRFKKIEAAWGVCMDEEYTYDGYSPKDALSDTPSGESSTTSSRGDVYYSSSTSSKSSRNPYMEKSGDKNDLISGPQ